MEKDNRFMKGFLSGLCAMLILAGVLLFVKGEMIKREQKASETLHETENTDTLHLDQEKVERKLNNIEDVINQYYLDEIDQNEVESWMYKGLIAGLGDTYAAYYTKEELQKTTEATSGSYKGIGAVLTQDRTTGLVTIVRCYEGTPSAEAGLLPGDVIYPSMIRRLQEPI